MALQLMYSSERVRGRRYGRILKVRPDYLFVKAARLPPAVGFPSMAARALPSGMARVRRGGSLLEGLHRV